MGELFTVRRHPVIKNLLPAKCLCGAELPIAGEFLEEMMCGVFTEACKECGAPPATISAYVHQEDNDAMCVRMRRISELFRK